MTKKKQKKQQAGLQFPSRLSQEKINNWLYNIVVQ